jgi:arginine deiminase
MGSLQRRKETLIMKFCFSKLGIEPLGEIKEPGLLEGGDFFPIGNDLCLIGVI